MSYSAVFFGSRYRKLLFASLLTVRICARIIISVALQQVDHAPNAKTGSEGNDQGLKNVHSTVEEIHIFVCRDRFFDDVFSLWKQQSRNEQAAVRGCRSRRLLSKYSICLPPTLRFTYCRCIVGRPPLRNGCLKNLYKPPVQAGACVSDTSASKTSNSSSGRSFSRVERYFSTSKAFLGFASERYL